MKGLLISEATKLQMSLSSLQFESKKHPKLRNASPVVITINNIETQFPGAQ